MTRSTDDELKFKPCPFCGGDGQEKWAHDGKAFCWIECTDCGAKGPWAKVGHDGSGLRNWNRRAPIPAPELCEDEGCPHHGTEHICVNNSPAPDVRVKPLEWWQSDTFDLCADTIVGRYQIQSVAGNLNFRLFAPGGEIEHSKVSYFPFDAAKAAAQADYEARIRAALAKQKD